MAKIGINGFGRLGRLLLRIAVEQCCKCGATGIDLPIVTIVNDPKISPECVTYLFKRDTFHRAFPQDVIDMDNCLLVAGQRIEVVQEADIRKIPWHKACPIQYVIDTTGQHATCSTASKFLQEGIKRVVVSGTADIPIFVLGVNHTCYKSDMKTLSAGSPSLNCLTAMLRVLHENFCVEKAMATVIQPLSSSDRILDDMKDNVCRESRSAMINLIPVKSAARGRYVTRVMPELDGKVESIAVKAPVPCVGAVDLTVMLKKEASYDMVKTKFKEASETYMKGIVRFSTEDLVSSDVIGDPHSCVMDAKAGIELSKRGMKIFAWYDAEYAFAHRLYDLLKYVISREQCVPEK